MQIGVPELGVGKPVAEREQRLLVFGVEPLIAEAHSLLVVGHETLPLLLIGGPKRLRISIEATLRHAENTRVRQVAVGLCKRDGQLPGGNGTSKDEIRDCLAAANTGIP